MKQAAQTGQSQQVPQNQSKAAKAAQQNQQANAQAAQKKAELGLQMMLSDLREAERRKLEELSKKLAEVQQQIANLIRRQAGHNLDNLGLQGKTVDKLDQKLADAARSLLFCEVRVEIAAFLVSELLQIGRLCVAHPARGRFCPPRCRSFTRAPARGGAR